MGEVPSGTKPNQRVTGHSTLVFMRSCKHTHYIGFVPGRKDRCRRAPVSTDVSDALLKVGGNRVLAWSLRGERIQPLGGWDHFSAACLLGSMPVGLQTD